MNKLFTSKKYSFPGSIIFVIAAMLLTLNIHAQDYRFGTLKLGGAGFVTGIITCPTEKNLIYARTDVGGAYRWVEETQSWKSLLDWVSPSQTSYLGVESVAIDPNEPNRLYMLVGTSYWNNGITAIIRSTDYGETFKVTDVSSKFKAHGNGAGRSNGERLAVDPNSGNILFCGTRAHGLFKSTDYGATWTKISTFPVTTTTNSNGICFIEFDASTATKGNITPLIFAGVSRKGSDNMFMSADSGKTWTPIAGQDTRYFPQRCLLAKGFLYVTYSDSEGPGSSGMGAVYKYDIANKTWKDISPLAKSYGGISVDPTNPDNIVVTTSGVWMEQPWIKGSSSTWGDDIYKSTNGGTTWANRIIGDRKAVFAEPEIEWVKKSSQLHWAGDIKVDPFNKDRVFVISGNGIYTSSNFTLPISTWKMALRNLEETVVLDLISIPGGPVVTAVGDYSGCVYYDISKYYPTHNPGLGSNTSLDYAGSKTNFLVRSGAGSTTNNVLTSVVYSENSGTTWTRVNTTALPTSKEGYVAVNADASIIAWTPGGSSKNYYTTDLGATWNNFDTGLGGTRIVADKVNKDIFYAVFSNVAWTFTWDGTKFNTNKLTLTGASNVSKNIRAVPGFEGEFWAPASNGLYRVSEKGTKFTPANNVASCQAVGLGKAAPGKTYPAIYMWGSLKSPAGVIGAYRSDDEGNTWVRVNDNLHQFGGLANGQFIIGDMSVYGRYYMSNAGLGTVYGELQTNVAIDKSEAKSVLAKIYPNVFEDVLTVETNEQLSYKVYSITGALVETGHGNGTIYIGASLNKGFYILELMDVKKNFRQVEKIVKQ